MLKKFLLLLLMAFILSACASTARHTHTNRNHTHDNWFGEDKVYHFFASSFAGAVATHAAVNNQASPCGAMVVGVSASFVIGFGKEWYDKNVRKTFFSWKDMVWDLAGGTLGSLIVSEC